MLQYDSRFMKFYTKRTKIVIAQDVFHEVGGLQKSRENSAIDFKWCLMILMAFELVEARDLTIYS